MDKNQETDLMRYCVDGKTEIVLSRIGGTAITPYVVRTRKLHARSMQDGIYVKTLDQAIEEYEKLKKM